jgi:hypothetical protein
MMLFRQERNYRRHRFIRADDNQALIASVSPVRNVKTLRSKSQFLRDVTKLRGDLQFAVSLEHFTIPPYLCALYSIREGSNAEAARIIQSVVVEEMLHMTLAANVLNAVGGKPKIGSRKWAPVYPSDMPHSAIRFKVNLLRFSKEAVNTFLRIERPAPPTEVPKPGKFGSIGQFYEAVRGELRRLDREKGIFRSKQNQVTGEHYYYDSGGKLFGVDCLHDAEQALDEIVGQGEGIDGSIKDGDGASFGDGIEYAHYFRFNEIFHERRYRAEDKPGDAPSGDPLPVDWNAVYNMVPNPKMSMFRNKPAVHGRMREFNRMYTKLLANLHRACDGKPELLMDGIPMMHAMRLSAVDLMQEPCDIGDYTAGPSFEIVP